MAALKEVKIFISYANEDREYLEKIKKYSLRFQNTQDITIWDDGEIKLGTEWNQEIKQKLNNADIILLLVSRDFLDSEYISETELTIAFEKHHKKQCTVIPVFIRYCGLEEYPQISMLQGYPKGKFFAEIGKEIDRYYAELEQAVKNVINEIRTTAGVNTASGEDKQKATEVILQQNALTKICLAHSDSEMSTIIKDYFLKEVEREKKYRKWDFDIAELPSFENALLPDDSLSMFVVYIITSEDDITNVIRQLAAQTNSGKGYRKVLLWISKSALEEKLTSLKVNKMVIGTMPAKVIEMIHLMEKERLEILSAEKEKFSQQINVYMLYDFEKDHNNPVRIALKETLESQRELLSFYTPPNPSLNYIEQQLQLSKGAIIFYGTADTNWYCYWQSEIQKIASLKSKAVCLSEPEKSMKIRRDVSRNAFIVMDDEQKMDEYVSQFVTKLKLQD